MKISPPNEVHAHKLVHETAIAMAHALYDTMMQDNQWYEAWKKANPGKSSKELEVKFCNKNVKRLLPQARATLAQMLTTSTDEVLKESIYEALLLDNTLKRGRPQMKPFLSRSPGL